MPGPSAAPIMLSCTGAEATDKAVVDALCDALAAEISAHAPERPFRRSSPNDPRPPASGTELSRWCGPNRASGRDG